MRFSSYALPALAANLVAALPAPQEIDLDMVLAIPDPTYSEAVGVTAQTITYDTASIIAQATASISAVVADSGDVLSSTAVAHEKRAAAPTTCAAQPSGANSVPAYSPDTAGVFADNAYFPSIASAAPSIPGYTQAFANKQASSNAFGYMGFDTFDTYDVTTCAQRCTAKRGCVSVNMYFERDPSVNPDDASCSNPPSVTMIKCAYWGGPVTEANTVNKGQPRGGFEVKIAGSNGYVSNQISTPAGFQSGVYYGKKAINAPYDVQGYNTFMGSKLFTTTWDASSCATYCDSQTAYNLKTAPKDGTPAKVCKFFNSYVLTALKGDGSVVTQGQYCTLYTEAWPASYATNSGQWRGNDQYVVDYSFGYSKIDAGSDPVATGDRTGAVYQARQDMTYNAASLTSTFLPYCSSLLGFTQAVTTVTPSATTTPVTTSTIIVTQTAFAKRDKLGQDRVPAPIVTPAVLTKYPAAIQSGACSLVASQPTGPASTVTANTVTVALPTQTSFVTSTVVTTSTTTVALPTGLLKVYDGTYDGLYIRADQIFDLVPFTTTTDKTQATTFSLDAAGHLIFSDVYFAGSGSYSSSRATNPGNEALLSASEARYGEAGLLRPVCSISGGALECREVGNPRSLLSICPNVENYFESQFATAGASFLMFGSTVPSGCERVDIVLS
ncbi:hypothetical protein E4T47_09330 [Aureobasidium subglaciale]|nr:hypothetical protein E4T43_06651 [Aureobasidium subglaciale]KAI5262172.1 hypothetical protein E4T47_09330 [Aureobasidium subglaciale]